MGQKILYWAGWLVVVLLWMFVAFGVPYYLFVLN
jgi:hypothetical protein